MSRATPSVLNGLSKVVPAPGTNIIDKDRSMKDDSNVSSRALMSTMGRLDRQPQAPRRSISPRRNHRDEAHTTLKATNASDKFYDSDGDHSVDNDSEFIEKQFGSLCHIVEHSVGEADFSEYDTKPAPASPERPLYTMAPPPPAHPPPMRHFKEDKQENSLYRLFGKKKFEYDKSQKPRKSSMRKPNSDNRNMHSIDNHKATKKDITRGISRNHSADGTEDTRRGSGSLHSVRMRGSIYPVHRRQSVGFDETVSVQEVTPQVELNDGNTRDLWLQADEAMEIKERRRGLLRRYKEREAKKKREAERMKSMLREQERAQRQQKVKNLLNPSKTNSLGPYLAAQQKKKGRWPTAAAMSGVSGIKKSDVPLTVTSPAGRRWKAVEHPSVMGLSVPSRGSEDKSSFCSLSLGAATSSFLSTSSGGSSFSGNGSDSFRGLEKYIDRSGRHQKNMVWDAVFMEQDEQLQFGYYDDERIAHLYRSVQNQHDGQQKAMGRARKDRKAADNYLNTPRTLRLLRKTIGDVDSIACDNTLLYEDVEHDETDDSNSRELPTQTNETDDSYGNGNDGKTDEKDSNADNKLRKPAKSITALKNSGDLKLRSKFLRRLSV